MSSSNCWFLTYIQVSQETGQVVWYFHLFQNFPQFIVIHTVKGFAIVNKAEIDVFLELSCFFNDPADVGNLISGSLAFSKSSFNIWKFMVHILLKPVLENFKHYFTSMWDECNYEVVWAFFGIAFLWDWNDLFQSCGHGWVFQNFWHIECSTFTASSFRTWNSSTGIPSPPLALFVVMLPKAHLTSHSRMSGSRWVITPSWLSGSWRSFKAFFFSQHQKTWGTPVKRWEEIYSTWLHSGMVASSGCTSLVVAKRSYPTSKVRSSGSEEIPHVQCKKQWLHFAGAVVKSYPTSKVRDTPLRW